MNIVWLNIQFKILRRKMREQKRSQEVESDSSDAE